MNKIFIILSVSLLLLLGACTKEISNNDSFTVYTSNALNDTAWLKIIQINDPIFALADSIFKVDILKDSIDFEKDYTFSFGDSLEVEVKGNSLVTGTGLFLNGKAKIEIIRLQRKGDFIKVFRPNSSYGTLLETAGGFFIRISKNGTELFLAPGKTINIKYLDIEAPKPIMQAYYGYETTPLPLSILDTANNWIPNGDTNRLKPWSQTNGSIVKKGYILESKKLRFISAAYPLQNSKPTTNIYAILPPNFTNKNTLVFAVFENNRTVLNMPSDYTARSFKVDYIPIGSKIRLVSISKVGSDYYLGTKSVNGVGTSVNYSFTPQKKKLAQILEYLNSL